MRRFAGALLAAAACAVQAAEWTGGGTANLRTEYIRNPDFAVPPSPSAGRTSLGLDLNLAARGEKWDASGNTSFQRWLSGEPNLDTTDANIAGRGTMRFERASASLAASYRRGSTQVGELATTGVLLTRTQSDNWSLAPSVVYSLTERLSVNAGALASGTDYDRTGGTTGLVNTSTNSWSLGASYLLDPMTTVGVTGSRTESDTDPFTTRTAVDSVQASISRVFDERWSASASYGPSQVHTEAAANAVVCPVPVEFCQAGLVPATVFSTVVTSDTRGSLYNVALNYTASDYTRLAGLASRSVNASGAGFATVTESVGATLAHRLQERLTANFAATSTYASSVGGLVPYSATKTYTLNAGLTWQASESWWLETGAFTTQVHLPQGLAPRSSTVYLGLRYAPARWLLRPEQPGLVTGR